MKIFSAFICLLIVGCSSPKVAQNSIRSSYQIDEKLLIDIQSKSSVTRSPASVMEEVKETSARRVYFKTLYQQYLTYTKISGEVSQIEHCPAFHLDFLETKGLDVLKVVSSASDKVRVIETELKELCDKGVTSHYYRFENLITYHVNKSSFHQDPRSILSLLKISVFENMLELKLKHGVAMNHPHLLDLTKTFWFSSYLEQHKVSRSAISFRDEGK